MGSAKCILGTSNSGVKGNVSDLRVYTIETTCKKCQIAISNRDYKKYEAE